MPPTPQGYRPWVVIPDGSLGSGVYTIVGFGEDYVVITIAGAPGSSMYCIDCHLDILANLRVSKVLRDVNIVFILFPGSCSIHRDSPDNHIYLSPEFARKIFPEPAGESPREWRNEKNSVPVKFKELKALIKYEYCREQLPFWDIPQRIDPCVIVGKV